MPIRIYRIVHAGAKSQFGGLKNGLFNVAYQTGMLEYREYGTDQAGHKAYAY